MSDNKRFESVLLRAVTDFDKKQSSRKGYNPYALAQYMFAIDAICESKLPIEQAIESETTPSTLRTAMLNAVKGR